MPSGGAIDFQGGWAFQHDSYYMYLVSNTLSQVAISLSVSTNVYYSSILSLLEITYIVCLNIMICHQLV